MRGVLQNYRICDFAACPLLYFIRREMGEEGKRERGISRRSGRVSRRQKTARGRSFLLIPAILLALLVCCALYLRGRQDKPIDLTALKAPEWTPQDFLPVDDYTRSGETMDTIRHILVTEAYPGASAEEARRQVMKLAYQTGTSKTAWSVHYMIDSEGSILQLIPLSERAQFGQDRAGDSVSIALLPESEGAEPNQAQKDALNRLTGWLTDTLMLDQRAVVSEK